jgi:SOS-response transcriptional repressor LexA
MQTAMGLGSRSGVHRLIHGLMERGYIATIPNRARAIEVLRMPDGKQISGVPLTHDEHSIIKYLRSHKNDIPKFLALCSA